MWLAIIIVCFIPKHLEVTWEYYLRLLSSSLFILDKKSGASVRRFEFVIEGGLNYRMSSSSTSNTRAANGGIAAPAPRSPYAKSCGMYSFHLEPTGIS